MKRSWVPKSFLWRSFFQTFIFSTLLFAIVAYFYRQSKALETPMDVMEVGSLFVFFVFYGILQWMFQKNSLSKLVVDPPKAIRTGPSAPPQPQETEAERAKRKNHEQRLFMHLFSVLQREGRLMDFFQEDLSGYEDGQIGAAVRTIHENCRKTLHRYLSPEPIMKQTEGEAVEISAGFDQHAVKLVGNVVGQPPFTGILRHRGWQLRSIALPKLSEAQNPAIIAPAEVEIP
jgi:hypothetical protein